MGAGRSRWHKLFPIVIVAVGLIAYANSLNGAFVFDDAHHILDNARIRSLTPVTELLTGRRPVVELSLAVNYALADRGNGLDPFGFHVVNIAVHLLAGLTLFGIVRRTLLLDFFSPVLRFRSGWLAFTVATLWVVHPLQTQAVTYIIQRGESMMGLCYLFTLYCVIRGATTGGGSTSPESTGNGTEAWSDEASAQPREDAAGWMAPAWYVLAMATCAIGMASKAVMVTAPIAVLAYDWVFLSRMRLARSFRPWPVYAGLAATSGVLYLSGVATGVLSTSSKKATVGFSVHDVTPFGYLCAQAEVLLRYLALSVWPFPQCLDYDWPRTQPFVDAVVPGLIVVGLLGISVLGIIRRKWLGFVGAWFFIVLAPTSSIVPVRDAMFEHRMYLSLATVVVIIVIGADQLLRTIAAFRTWSDAGRRIMAAVILFAGTYALTIMTVHRNEVYGSDARVWKDVLSKRPTNSRAWLGLGAARYKENRRTGDLKLLEESVDAFAEAARLVPDYDDAFYNMGNSLRELGRFDEAERAYRQTIERNPRHYKCIYNLANLLKGRGRYDEAIDFYFDAIRVHPGHVSARINLGNTFKILERWDDAIEQYLDALELAPGYANALDNLGEAYLRKGDMIRAEQCFRDALRRDPGRTAAQKGLLLIEELRRSP